MAQFDTFNVDVMDNHNHQRAFQSFNQENDVG